MVVGRRISKDRFQLCLRKHKRGKLQDQRLYHCAEQWCIYTDFQWCMDCCRFPKREIALTSLVVKCLEKILKDSVLCLVEGELDTVQFAYQRNKGVDDAKLFILDTISRHLSGLIR